MKKKEKTVIKVPQAKPTSDSGIFQAILKTFLAYNPKEDVDYLTREQCLEINERLFNFGTRDFFFIKRVIDRIESSFVKGKISKEERDRSIAIFNRLTNSNFIRREGSNKKEYKYIYKDFCI
jgi:hypothetical protein